MTIIIRAIIIPYLLAMLFFFGVVQFQYEMLGQILVYSYQVKMIGFVTLIAVFMLFILKKKRIVLQKNRLLNFILIYMAYIIFQFIYHFMFHQMSFDAVSYGIVYFYFYVLVLLLLLLFYFNALNKQQEKHFDEKHAETSFNWLSLIAIPTFILGYMQFILNDPILGLGEADTYQVQSYIHLASNQTRAFSIFSSGYQFGHFITFIGTLAASYAMKSKKLRSKAKYLMILIAAGVAMYTTYTRNSYIEFLFSVLAAFLVKFAVSRKLRNSHIISYSFMSSGLAFWGIIEYVRSTGLSGLLDPGSFLIRMYNQSRAIEKFFTDSNETMNILFGYGLMQGVKFSTVENIKNIMIDNTYINISLFSGLVGLLLYIVFFILMFDYILKRYKETQGSWWQALAAMFFSYPIVAASNIYLSQLLLFACITISFHVKATLENKSNRMSMRFRFAEIAEFSVYESKPRISN